MTDQPQPALDDGGAAFPTLMNVAYKSDWQTEHSMSLRDAAALAALPAILKEFLERGVDGDNHREANAKIVAEASYRVADAMISARKGGAADV